MHAVAVSDPAFPSARVVATIGPPDSTAYADLERLLGCGTIRINLAFAGPDTYEPLRALVRRIRAVAGDRVCVMLDCVGPRVKLAPLPRDGVPLATGQELQITTASVPSTPGRLSTIFEPFPEVVQPGQRVLLAEGRMRLDVVARSGPHAVTCKVIRGGVLKKRGLNLPDTELPVPALSARDRRDLDELLQEDVDLVALSFVRGVADLRDLREFLDARGLNEVRIMAKIETRQAVRSIEAIAQHCDAVMVARGDLWAELENPWALPRVTTRIIAAGNALGVPVVTATQLLPSMVDRDLPSRAEVDELFFLLREGSDAIMGSEEFAIGRHPAAVIAAIRAVSTEVDAVRAESDPVTPAPPLIVAPTPSVPHSHAPATEAFDREAAAIAWAEHSARVRCIVAISDYGGNARKLYRRRGRKPMVIVTNRPKTARYLQLFGVQVALVDYTREDEDHHAIVRAGLSALGITGAEETAVLVVRHGVSEQRSYSKIEEVPLPG